VEHTSGGAVEGDEHTSRAHGEPPTVLGVGPEVLGSPLIAAPELWALCCCCCWDDWGLVGFYFAVCAGVAGRQDEGVLALVVLVGVLLVRVPEEERGGGGSQEAAGSGEEEHVVGHDRWLLLLFLYV